MANVWRRCPSYRLRSPGFIGCVPGDYRSYVADDFFESDIETGTLVDIEKVLQSVYDPTQNAIRVIVGTTKTEVEGNLDAGQILKKLYDPTNHALRVSTDTASGTFGSGLSWQQIIKKCFSKFTINLKIVE